VNSFKYNYIFIIIYILACAVHAERESFDPEKLGNSAYCGHCHTDIFHQWNASTHHFSSFNNPIYRKVALLTLEEKGSETLEFCANCHDPILARSNDLDEKKFNGWAATAGITCLTCHRITDHGTSNGDIKISEPLLHPFALSEKKWLQKAHKTMLKATPILHTLMLTKDSYSEPEFCASCHSLTVPSSINGLRDMPILLEYEHWSNSQHAHSDQHGNYKNDCISCHMPEVASEDPAAKDGLIKSHRFSASHTIIPAFNRDLDQFESVESFLQDRIELHVKSHIVEKKRNIKNNYSITLNSIITVKNSGVGHRFPGGTMDSNQAWLRLTYRDNMGATLYSYGSLDDNENIPAESIRFGATYLNKDGDITDRRNSTTESVKEELNTTLAPGEERTYELTFSLEDIAGGTVLLNLDLLWRKYEPEFIEWVFEGKQIPEIPITTISSTEERIVIPENTD